jgi:hypothetical protein
VGIFYCLSPPPPMIKNDFYVEQKPNISKVNQQKVRKGKNHSKGCKGKERLRKGMVIQEGVRSDKRAEV